MGESALWTAPARMPSIYLRVARGRGVSEFDAPSRSVVAPLTPRRQTAPPHPETPSCDSRVDTTSAINEAVSVLARVVTDPIAQASTSKP